MISWAKDFFSPSEISFFFLSKDITSVLFKIQILEHYDQKNFFPLHSINYSSMLHFVFVYILGHAFLIEFLILFSVVFAFEGCRGITSFFVCLFVLFFWPL